MLLEQFVNEIKFSLPIEYPFIERIDKRIIPRKRIIAPLFPEKRTILRHKLERFIKFDNIQTSLTIAGIVNYAVEQMSSDVACCILGGRNKSPFLYSCALCGNGKKSIYFSCPTQKGKEQFKMDVERYVYAYKKNNIPVFYLAPIIFLKWYKYSFNQIGTVSRRLLKFPKSEKKFGLIIFDFWYDSDKYCNKYNKRYSIHRTLLEAEDILSKDAYIIITGTSYKSRWIQVGVFRANAKYEYDIVFHNAPDITKMDSVYTFWNGLTILKRRSL